MYTYEFKSMEELEEFIAERSKSKREATREAYFWGVIDNFNKTLYTLQDLKDDVQPVWFEDGATATVYEFEYSDIVERERMERFKEAREELYNLIDDTLGMDIEWRRAHLDEAKELIESCQTYDELISLFEQFYNYARSLEDSEAITADMQDYGEEHLDVRFCERCGAMMTIGYYFPTFSADSIEEATPEYMCERCYDIMPESFKKEWEEYYPDEGEDCWTTWGEL